MYFDKWELFFDYYFFLVNNLKICDPDKDWYLLRTIGICSFFACPTEYRYRGARASGNGVNFSPERSANKAYVAGAAEG